MSIGKFIPVLAILTLIQSSLVSSFSIFGGMANLPLCFFILSAFIYDNEIRTILIGVTFGLISDLIVSRVIGINPLSVLILGILIVLIKNFLNYESKISVIILGAVGSVVTTSMAGIVTGIFGSHLSWIRLMKFTIIESLLNILAMLLMYLIMIKMVNKRPKRSRYERYEII